jgi:prephenate dehydrogenase
VVSGKIKKIAIIGTGLVGGSLGMAIKRLSNPPQVLGFSRSFASCEKAVKKKAIDVACRDIADCVKDADVVFIATPVGKIVEIVRQISSLVKEGAIISDVGSTKSSIVNTIESFLAKNIYFIGGHPVTGSEHDGIEYADANLFHNFYYVLTPTKSTDSNAYKTLHTLLASIGANVLAVEADKHDQILATLSHLPHMVAALLVNMASKQVAGNKNWLSLAAGGFRDTTRIAASKPGIWLDICLENKQALVDNLREFEKYLKELIGLIEDGDVAKLRKVLTEARNTRLSLPVAGKKDFSKMQTLMLLVADEPGVISDIGLTLGKLGINIEDIEIVPLTDKTGFLRLTVLGKKEAKSARAALKEKGYSVEIKQ